MKKRIYFCTTVLLVLILTLVLLVACNPDESSQNNNNASGDNIFTENATYDEILSAMEKAKSLTYTQEYQTIETSSTGEQNSFCGTYQYKADVNAFFVDGAVTIVMNGIVEPEDSYSWKEYYYRSNGVDYRIGINEDESGTSNDAKKDLEQIDPNTYVDTLNAIGAEMFGEYITTDAEGNIVVDTADMEDYIDGSAYVKLNGRSIELGYSESYAGEDGIGTETYKMIWSNINDTTVDIPDDIKALEASAEWSDYVSYNGVSYQKDIDADGNEYYYVDNIEPGSVPEKTINTLPVKEQNDYQLSYSLSYDGNSYMVSGYSGTPRFIDIPDNYEGMPVSGIGEFAFAGCSALQSVVMPDSVTSIGKDAFAESGLVSVLIPDSVTTIGEMAFSMCRNLQQVKIGTGVTSIGKSAFTETAVSEVVIPDGVENIGDSAFRKCANLRKLTIGTNVQSIGNLAFDECTLLEQINWNVVASSVEGLNDGNVFKSAGAEGSGINVIFGENVTAIPDHLFYVNDSRYATAKINSLTISSSVKQIGDASFGTKDLPHAEINEISFGGEIADWCEINGFANLLPFAEGASVRTAQGALEGSVTIPADTNLRTQETYTFYGCYGITSAIFADDVLRIDAFKFYNCKNLTSVTIGSSVWAISESAFEGCTSLTSVKFNGTMSQWKDMMTGANWNKGCPFTEVVCSDGTVKV